MTCPEAFDSCNSMPWDEASDVQTRALQEEVDASSIYETSVSEHWRPVGETGRRLRKLMREADEVKQGLSRALKEEQVDMSSIYGTSVSNEWRRIGEAWRKLLLDEDRRNGGTDFELNKSCIVDRYFQVAHRALEQFHKMYQEGDKLEETYIMGYRMVVFLTECLPRHPGYRRPVVANLRKQYLWELDHLQICLDELALKIDEEQCNRFAEDFDPLVHVDDDDSDSEDEEVSSAAYQCWASFEDTKSRNPKAESPTGTVATSCTSSSGDCYSSDDGMPERKLDFSDYDVESPTDRPSYLVELGTDFLEKVANEEVEYETDSEAADSWAQGDDAESYAPSYRSGHGIVCDPARIALQDLASHLAHAHSLSPIAHEDSDGSVSSAEDEWSPPRRPDPPAEISRLSSPESRTYFLEKDRNSIRQCPRESAVACEIQRFLDASFEYDPSRVFDSSMEQLNKVSPSKRSSSSDESEPSRGSSSDLAMAPANKEIVIFPADDGWVNFASGQQSSPRSYRVLEGWSQK